MTLLHSIGLLLIITLCAAGPVQAGLPALPEIPSELPDEVRQPLIVKRAPLAHRKLALIKEGEVFNRTCVNLEKGSSRHRDCLAKEAEFGAHVEALRRDIGQLVDEIDAAVQAEGARIIKSMNALAARLGWSADERARLEIALNSLDFDGDPSVTSAQIIHSWQEVLARGPGGDLARAASRGEGPGFPGAGTQTPYQDCTIFALANAAGLPYGVVATRAAELIRQGDWRGAAERANPQHVIEQKGLNGGEVVMLAEAFGQAEVVPSVDFEKTLKAGRPVMVNVVPQDGDVRGGHEVVLIRTFHHGGAPWFEMMDSTQGAQRRLYVSAKELSTLLQENGVAFRPEPGTTPSLLR
jgi:hypothetical protein